MQRYTVFFITVNALYMFWVAFPPIIRSSKSSSKLDIKPDAVCTVFELLMMGGEAA